MFSTLHWLCIFLFLYGSYYYMRLVDNFTIPFTHIALMIGMIGVFMENNDVLAIATSLFSGIAFSFYAVPFFDSNAYFLLMKKNKWSSFEFHCGNFAVHLFPCILTLHINTQFLHRVCAAVIQFSWGLYMTNGTLCLDDVYIPISKKIWYKLWFVTLLGNLCPLSFLKSVYS